MLCLWYARPYPEEHRTHPLKKRLKPVSLYPTTNVAASGQTYGPCEWRENRKLFGLILILGAYPSWAGDSKDHLSSGLSSLDVTAEAAYGFLINHKPASLSTNRLQNLSLLKTDPPHPTQPSTHF